MLEGLKFKIYDMAMYTKKKGLKISGLLEALEDLEVQAELIQVGYSLKSVKEAYDMLQEASDNGMDLEEIQMAILTGLKDSNFYKEQLEVSIQLMTQARAERTKELAALLK